MGCIHSLLEDEDVLMVILLLGGIMYLGSSSSNNIWLKKVDAVMLNNRYKLAAVQ